MVTVKTTLTVKKKLFSRGVKPKSAIFLCNCPDLMIIKIVFLPKSATCQMKFFYATARIENFSLGCAVLVLYIATLYIADCKSHTAYIKCRLHSVCMRQKSTDSKSCTRASEAVKRGQNAKNGRLLAANTP